MNTGDAEGTLAPGFGFERATRTLAGSAAGDAIVHEPGTGGGACWTGGGRRATSTVWGRRCTNLLVGKSPFEGTDSGGGFAAGLSAVSSRGCARSNIQVDPVLGIDLLESDGRRARGDRYPFGPVPGGRR